jgi:glycosyltransferase involved in cell wall biosynthesis
VKKDRVSLLLPTRNRPANLRRLHQSLEDTSRQRPEVVLYVDEDDQVSADMAEDLGWKYVQGPRICLSEMWNEAYKISTGDILMHAGDDIIFRTKSWDYHVVKAFSKFPDRLIFAHGDDGHWGKRFGTHGFIHKNWVDVVGYFVPPYFSSDYNDTWLNDVANRLGRRVYLPIMTEHMHFLFGKAELDETHRERLDRHKRDNVGQLYDSLLPKRLEDVEKLKSAIAAAEGK